MATEKVGIYRKYYGPTPEDKSDQPLPRSEWPRKRLHSWVARWFDLEGKRYSKSFKTRKEAEVFAELKQKEIRIGKANPQPKITLAAYRKEHSELMEGNVAPKSLCQHLASIDLLVDLVGDKKLLDKITVRDIERLRANRLKNGASPATANKDMKALRRVFNLAILRGYLPRDSNPCVGIPMLKIGSKQQVYIRPDDFRKVYHHAPSAFWRALLVTLYTTGLRLREALNLTWKDIDFESDMLCISRRAASGFVQAWTPKDHELRRIPFPEQATSLLTAWHSVAPEGCPYVFMEHARWEYYYQRVMSGKWKSGQDLTNNVLRRFNTICRKAAVGPYSLHDMRRSCITNWAKHLPIHVVKQLAGHSDIRTTQQYYLSVQPEDVNRAQEVQAAIVGEIPRTDLTDPKVTHSVQKRAFPDPQGRRAKLLLLH
jgi:integrase